MDPSLIMYNRIMHKFRLAKVNSFAIVEKCEKIDKTKDRMIHIDDLEDIIQGLLGSNRLTMREIMFLLSSITHNKRKGLVIYDHMHNFFETEPPCHEPNREKWRNDIENEDVLPKGSIGEFLQHAACPIEIKNFKKFIAMIEKYEKSTGVSVDATKDGFVVPLGPDLRVSIEFFMA